jgi:tetratricopeptide (TPR) repeat protein
VSLVAFSADGKRLAVASGNHVRVWDVATGEPLGPALVLGTDDQHLNYLVFTPECDLVTAAGAPGDPLARQTWQLKQEARPATDLLSLAQVLAGQRPDDAGRLAPFDDAELVKTWRDLRAKHAPDLTLSGQRALAWDRRGAEECEQHQLWQGAVLHLDRLVEAKAGGWELHARRARALTELRRWEPALADFSKALEQQADRWELWAGRATAAANLGRWEQVTTDLSKAIDLRPRDAELLARRGRAEAERGRWEQAAADLGKATRMGLNDVNAWHEEALLALARNDARTYQRTCATMVRRFGGSEDEVVSRTLSWTCALAAEAVPDLKPLVARTERAVSANPSSADDLRALAALLYRSSQFEAAQRRAEQALRLPGFANDPTCGFLLAMIHQHLDHADEAKQWLAKTAGWADEAAKAKPGGPPLSWSRRLEFQVFRREAEQLVK